jgi:hypothetical protein
MVAEAFGSFFIRFVWGLFNGTTDGGMICQVCQEGKSMVHYSVVAKKFWFWADYGRPATIMFLSARARHIQCNRADGTFMFGERK